MDPFYLALLLYLAAIVLAAVDLFVPSGGMLAILAAVAATACVLLGFRSGMTMGMTMLTLVVISVPAFAVSAILIWPKTPIGRRVILGAPQNAGKSQTEELARKSLVGTVVRAEHPLMPTGQIRLGGKRYNATTNGEIIEAGQNVEVVGFRERNLVVRFTTAQCSPKLPEQNAAESEDEGKGSGNLLDLPADEIGIDSLE